MEYFLTLDANEKRQIPAGLMTEIKTLLDLSTNSWINFDATQNLRTCISTRRGELITAMSGHNELLSGISVSAHKKKDLTGVAMAEFESAKKRLVEAIKGNTYKYKGGHDAFGINMSLLETLNVMIHVSSLSDLTVIQSLSPSEITEVFKKNALKNETIMQLRTLDNLIIFAMETSPERLKAFLTVMADKIAETWLRSSLHLAALLASLDEEKSGVVCKSMTTSCIHAA